MALRSNVSNVPWAVVAALLATAIASGWESGYAFCVAAAAIVAVVPIGYRVAGRTLGYGARIAEPFTIAITAMAIRALFGPPSWLLSVAVALLGVGAGAFIAASRSEAPATPCFGPRRSLAIAAIAGTLLAVAWMATKDRVSVDAAWTALEELPTRNAFFGTQSPTCEPRSISCLIRQRCNTLRTAASPPQCVYVVDGKRCLVGSADSYVNWGGDNATSGSDCPALAARHAPGDSTIVVGRRKVASWSLFRTTGDLPDGPSTIRGDHVGLPASPFVVAATRPPAAWLWTAAAGTVAAIGVASWLASRARPRVLEAPDLGPYRRRPSRPDDESSAASASGCAFARLILISATAPCFIAFAATLVRTPRAAAESLDELHRSWPDVSALVGPIHDIADWPVCQRLWASHVVEDCAPSTKNAGVTVFHAPVESSGDSPHGRIGQGIVTFSETSKRIFRSTSRWFEVPCARVDVVLTDDFSEAQIAAIEQAAAKLCPPRPQALEAQRQPLFNSCRWYRPLPLPCKRLPKDEQR